MNAKQIESGFAAIGARLNLHQIPSRWRRGDRQWISPLDYALDLRRDSNGEFFELRVPTHLSDTLDVTVMQSEPKQRHLLLLVRKDGDKPQLDRFLCGYDEREWFVAAVPGRASSVRQAMDALQPARVRQALASKHVSTRKRYARKNRAFRRQGEWFFISEPSLVVDDKLVLRNEPLRRGAGKPHIVEQLFRAGGEMVHVCSRHPNGISPVEYHGLLKANPKAARWGWRVMTRNPGVYARGAVSHCGPCEDHAAGLASGGDEYRNRKPDDGKRGVPGLSAWSGGVWSIGCCPGLHRFASPSFQFQIFSSSRSSIAEHPVDNRKTQGALPAGTTTSPSS